MHKELLEVDPIGGKPGYSVFVLLATKGKDVQVQQAFWRKWERQPGTFSWDQPFILMLIKGKKSKQHQILCEYQKNKLL